MLETHIPMTNVIYDVLKLLCLYHYVRSILTEKEQFTGYWRELWREQIQKKSGETKFFTRPWLYSVGRWPKIRLRTNVLGKRRSLHHRYLGMYEFIFQVLSGKDINEKIRILYTFVSWSFHLCKKQPTNFLSKFYLATLITLLFNPNPLGLKSRLP